MCYEERYFAEWAAEAARKREEARRKAERRTPDSPRDRPKPETAKPPVVEEELEAV